jgi:hypothetical protein
MTDLTNDGLKEELGWLKVVLVLVATFDASIIGWLVNDASPNRPLSGFVFVVALAGSIWVIRLLRQGWALVALLKESAS